MKKFILTIISIVTILSCTSNSKENSINGLVVEKGRNDQLTYINYYEKGKIEGVSMSFHDNGKLYTFGYYTKDSILHGPGLIFFRNGSINVYDNYLNGVKEGLSVFYNDKGIMIDKEYYRNGKRDGEQYYFKENGDTLRVDFYEMGELKYSTNK